MHDKYIRQYLGRAREWLDTYQFNRVLSTVKLMEKVFKVRTFKYNELPMGYDNQLFRELVLHQKNQQPNPRSRPWAKHFFGIRTYRNNSLVLVCPPIDNPLTRGARNKKEQLTLISRKLQRDIAAYNTVKPSFKPRLTHRVTDLLLYSPDTVAIFIFQEGMYESNEQAQKHFLKTP